jgi:hypothetical protein
LIPPGGIPHYSYKLVNLFYNYTDKLFVIVADSAKSAATSFCLGASKIFMAKDAELGPIDILTPDPKDNTKSISILDSFRSVDYLREYTVSTIIYLVNFFIDEKNFGMDKYQALQEAEKYVSDIITPLYKQINPLELGSYSRKLNLALKYGVKIMERYSDLNFNQIFKIVWSLTWDYPAHEFVIDFKEAKDLGLPVEILGDDLEDLCKNILDKSGNYCMGFISEEDEGKVEGTNGTVI